MKLPSIFVSDLHMTASPQDEYRWGLFPWLKEQAKKNRARSVAILGDLTDAKDYHPSVLVNRLVSEIVSLREAVDEVNILSGNHDYLKDGHPFFSFLSSIPGVRFITEPWSDTETDLQVLWLPHSKSPATAWSGFTNLSWYSHIFMHQTVKGSLSSNGQRMEGEGMESVPWFKKSPDLPEIWSGDVHVPQKIGLVEYVGSPYHVHFGDRFEPRAILLERGGRRKDLHFSTLHRFSVTASSLGDLQDLDVAKGDQVKVKFVLGQAEQHDWPRHRKAVELWAERAQVELCGLKLEVEKSRRRLNLGKARHLSPKDVVFGFVEQEDLGPEAYEIGLEIIES